MTKFLLTTNRYNQFRFIEDVDIDRGVFRITGDSKFIRMACEPDTYPPKNTMFDFDGGPCIVLGEDFYEMGIVTNISASDGGAEITIDYNKKFKKNVKKVLLGEMSIKAALGLESARPAKSKTNG